MKNDGWVPGPQFRGEAPQLRNSGPGTDAGFSASLEKSEASMEPVFIQLEDNVLFLKHNLNAAAIGGLRAEVANIEADIETLLADMRASIAEADRFLSTLPK